MNAREQYREAYRLTRQYHKAATDKPAERQQTIARAFMGVRDMAGIDWRIDHAARDSYLRRRAVPGPSLRFLLAKVDRLTKAVSHA